MQASPFAQIPRGQDIPNSLQRDSAELKTLPLETPATLEISEAPRNPVKDPKNTASFPIEEIPLRLQPVTPEPSLQKLHHDHQEHESPSSSAMSIVPRTSNSGRLTFADLTSEGSPSALIHETKSISYKVFFRNNWIWMNEYESLSKKIKFFSVLYVTGFLNDGIVCAISCRVKPCFQSSWSK